MFEIRWAKMPEEPAGSGRQVEMMTDSSNGSESEYIGSAGSDADTDDSETQRTSQLRILREKVGNTVHV